VNFDHPLHDEDPENDGTDRDYITECPNCGYDSAPGRELCQVCFDAEHGPDNDKDLDPERSGGYTLEVRPC